MKGCVKLSDRAVMKRRVRGLLHKKWLGPLCVLILAGVPMAVALYIATFIMQPFWSGVISVSDQISLLFTSMGDTRTALYMLTLGGHVLDYSMLIASLPAVLVLVLVYLFIGLPMSVSVSTYFLSYLRGKEPKIKEAFTCFSNKYPRMLGGMLYMQFWLVLWGFMGLGAPFLLYKGLFAVIEYFAEALRFYQIHLVIALAVLCVVWFFVFTFGFINRIVAYSQSAVCIAAQPRLPAWHAVRISRKLMRGNKWQFISLHVSFIGFYVPAIVAAVLLLLLPVVEPLLGISEFVLSALRIAFLAIMGINALVTLFVAPYLAACRCAFYIERKREALMDEEISQTDFAPTPKPRKAKEKPAKGKGKAASATPDIQVVTADGARSDDDTGSIPELKEVNEHTESAADA